MSVTQQIVQENVQVTPAPAPSILQQSGALVSVGGTTITTGDTQFFSGPAAALAVLSDAGNFAELTNQINTYFAQNSGSPNVGISILELGVQSPVSAGITALEAFINGTEQQQFYGYAVPFTWDGLSGVISVTVTDGGTGYTGSPTVAFSAPGGSGTTATGTVVAVGGVITGVTITNPGTGYTAAPTLTFTGSGTDAAATATIGSPLNAMAANFSSNTSKTYFVVKTTSTTISAYAPTTKSIIAWVDSPTAASTESGAAAMLYNLIAQNPSAAMPAGPVAYRFLFGITPWPQTVANQAAITTILTAFGNIALTGAEGQISNAIIFKGTVMSGAQIMQWYGLDWFQIQCKISLAAGVIAGSNTNPPLIYSQGGINTLETGLQTEVTDGISFQLLQSASISAVPFATFIADNPSDFPAGIYSGFSATAVSQSGFLTITFDIDAVQF
jgi:hypothetical protein